MAEEPQRVATLQRNRVADGRGREVEQRLRAVIAVVAGRVAFGLVVEPPDDAQHGELPDGIVAREDGAVGGRGLAARNRGSSRSQSSCRRVRRRRRRAARRARW